MDFLVRQQESIITMVKLKKTQYLWNFKWEGRLKDYGYTEDHILHNLNYFSTYNYCIF